MSPLKPNAFHILAITLLLTCATNSSTMARTTQRSNDSKFISIQSDVVIPTLYGAGFALVITGAIMETADIEYTTLVDGYDGFQTETKTAELDASLLYYVGAGILAVATLSHILQNKKDSTSEAIQDTHSQNDSSMDFAPILMTDRVGLALHIRF
jgi:hypothetical protein